MTGTARPLALVAVAIALTAVLHLLAADARLGYDTAHQLVWGRELLHGHLPGYDVRLAPTPHPLQVLVAVPLALLGQGADEAMQLLSLLGFALLGLALLRIGTLLFSLPVGVLAAALLLTRPHLIELAFLGDADVAAAALAAWAAAVALAGGRPAVVLGLLALAGLLRPEAWLLSAAYLTWSALARGRDAGELMPLAALAAAGPVLWGLSDLAATGDALWSLHHTRTGTELLGRPTGAGEAVQLPRHLRFLAGAPVLAVGLLGLAAGLVAARRRMPGPVAVLVLLGGGFLALALAGLSLQPRYLAGLAAAVVVCAAVGGLGWRVLRPDDPWRGRWRAAGAVGLAALLVGLPFDGAELADVRGRLVDDGRALEALARGPARSALRDCGLVGVPTIRPVPFLALWTGAAPEHFAEAGGGRPLPRTLVSPTADSESWIGGGGEGQPGRVLLPAPAGAPEVAADPAWRIAGGC